MTKTDELATRAAKLYMITGDPQAIRDALTEYGEHIKAEAVKVCNKYASESSHPMNFAENCAAAIEKMPLP